MQWVYELNRGYKWPVAQWPSMWAVISLKFNQFLFKFIIEPRLMKVEVTMILRYMCDAHASVASSVGCQLWKEGCKSSSFSIVSKSIKYRFYNAIKMCRIIDKYTLPASTDRHFWCRPEFDFAKWHRSRHIYLPFNSPCKKHFNQVQRCRQTLRFVFLNLKVILASLRELSTWSVL